MTKIKIFPTINTSKIVVNIDKMEMLYETKRSKNRNLNTPFYRYEALLIIEDIVPGG